MSKSFGIRQMLSFTLLTLSLFPLSEAVAQCVGLPSVSSLGSNKFPVGLCAPVNANVTYNVTFTSAVPAGTLELVYNWNDGSALEVIPLAAGTTTYSASRIHNFPAESDCEYIVTMTIRYNGVLCTTTRQIQKIASWRVDKYNGGEIGLVAPGTGLVEHLVCEGEDINVTFKDETKWNCNAQYIQQPPNPIESPNIENRWQQIVYNTNITGSKIPNIQVNGVPVTGASGNNILANYQDPRGILYIASPVFVEDARRRPSLQITATGGFGSGFPKAGDVFAITLRYWNFCNPYDDPNIPGPPADLVNGDNAPIERVTTIKIVAPPQAPVVTNQTVCNGTTPSAFSVTGVPVANIVRWYENIPGPDRPGNLIATSRTLAITLHPDWTNNVTAGAYKVWVSHQATTTGATNCESPKSLAVRSIRESPLVPDPLTPIPAEICNNNSLTVSLPGPVTEAIGGNTSYSWTGSSGVTLASSTASSATFSVNIASFGTALYVDRTITVNRQFTSTPTCSKSRVFTIRINKPAVGGTLSASADVCESTAVEPITVSGYTGEIVRWEIKKDGNAYERYTGAASGASISPGFLSPGKYSFRAVLKNGACNEVYSNEENVEVFVQPAAAYAGDDQFICTSLSSAALNASDASPGVGTWSYVSSIPAGLPAPIFSTDKNDPNTSLSVLAENAGAYKMRWTVLNGLCTSSDDVVIDFGTNPSDPAAGPDKSVCGIATALEGNAPEKGLGHWSIVSGPNGCTGDACSVTILSPTSPASSVELKGIPIYGSYTFRWSISSGGNNCFVKTDDVVVRFDESAKVSASDILDICLDASNLTAIKLTGTAEGSFTNVAWQNISGNGTVTTSTVSGTGVYTVDADYIPSLADYDAGLPIHVKLIAQPSAASSCLPVEKIIRIIIDRKPVANAGANIPYVCDDAVKLNADIPLHGASGIWTSTQAGVTFDNYLDPKTTIRNLPAAPGNTIATWTLTSASGKCISEPSSVTLTRVLTPPVTDLNVTECEISGAATSVILQGYENSVTTLGTTDREITWYKNAAPPSGIPIANPAEAQTGVTDGQVYIARIRDVHTTCTSDARLTVSVRLLPKVMNGLVKLCEDTPGGNIASGIDLTQATYTAAITQETNVDIVWYNTVADAMNNVAPITQSFPVNYSKEVFARVTYRDTPFCFAIAKLTILVSSRPTITAIVGRESVCQGSQINNPGALPVEIYQVTPIPGAKYYWEVPNDPATQFKVFGGGNESDFYLLLQFPNIYTGKIKVRAELNGCSGQVIEKEISVSPAPIRPVIKGSTIVCENSSSVAFSVTPNNYPSSTYNWEIRKVSDNSIGGADIIEGQSTGNILTSFQKESVVISVRENNAICASPIATKVVTVATPPKASLSIEKNISCFLEKDGAVRTTVTGGTIPYVEYKLLQTGEVDANNDGLFENLQQGSYSVRVKDSNGCEATSNVQVLNQPAQVLITTVKVLTDANGYNLSCRDASDGAIDVSFSGGKDTGIYTVTAMRNGDVNPIQLQGKSNVTFTGLLSGTYTIVVKDENGCSSQPSVAFVINPPLFYGGLIGVNQSICSGVAPARIEELSPASGGVGNYTYEWQESSIGNVNDDAAWTTIAGADGATYSPPLLTTTRPQGEQRYYRRLVRSISLLHGSPKSCEIKGKGEKITITINPIPQVQFSANANPVCYGEPLSLMLDLTVGTAPIEYSYTTSSGITSSGQGGKNTIITIGDFKKADTFTLLQVKDANGCAVQALPQPLAIGVVNLNSDFTIVGSPAQCNGNEFTFSWNVESGIDYRWEWADGTVNEFKAGALASGAQQIKHRFPVGSNLESTIYPVKLFVKSPSCREKYSSQPVTVYPGIAMNIIADDAAVCSGETITFRDNSSGIDHGKWYYHEPGSSQRLDEKPGGQQIVTFTLNNTTLNNPILYEVVYEASNNEGCNAEYKKQVSVYRGSIADFKIGPITQLKGDVSGVTFTNTSPVIDRVNFEYTWNFGTHGTLASDNGVSYDVHYFSPGEKDVTLNVINIKARAAGENCNSGVTKRITIPTYALDATFKVSRTASCLPADIEVENNSTGADTFLWKVYNAEKLVTTSNLRTPVFKITDPGIYDVYLTASYAATGQSDEASFKGIKVLDVPLAAFAVRSDIIYVPDTELEVTNFSTGANLYEWNFGDGGTSTEFEPDYMYQSEGKYTITLLAGIDHGDQDIDGDGTTDGVLVCYDSAQQEVATLNGGSIQIPNAFTPSAAGPSGGRERSGGFNDVFRPKVKGVTEYTMQIFNRWGTLVFESRDPEIGWDGYDRNGKFMIAGVYVYRIVLTQSNGQRITRIGDVTLIR